MISAFNHRLLLIEQALSNNGAVLAQLQLLELDSKPGADASSQSDCDDSDQHELDRLRDWVVRLRAQVARTERRIERLRASIERHDAQLSDIKSRIIWSSGGCAVVRPHTRWDVYTGESGTRCDSAATRRLVNGKWALTVHIPRQKPTNATTRGGSWSARNVVDCSGVTPQLSHSFTSLLSAKQRQHSGVRVSAHATSRDNRSLAVVPHNLHRSADELDTFR